MQWAQRMIKIVSVGIGRPALEQRKLARMIPDAMPRDTAERQRIRGEPYGYRVETRTDISACADRQEVGQVTETPGRFQHRVRKRKRPRLRLESRGAPIDCAHFSLRDDFRGGNSSCVPRGNTALPSAPIRDALGQA